MNAKYKFVNQLQPKINKLPLANNISRSLVNPLVERKRYERKDEYQINCCCNNAQRFGNLSSN